MDRAYSTHWKDENIYIILCGSPVEKIPIGKLCTDGKIILKWTLKKHVAAILFSYLGDYYNTIL
jgi:hypothetical protein